MLLGRLEEAEAELQDISGTVHGTGDRSGARRRSGRGKALRARVRGSAGGAQRAGGNGGAGGRAGEGAEPPPPPPSPANWMGTVERVQRSGLADRAERRFDQRPPRAWRALLGDPPAAGRHPRKLAVLFWCLLTRGENYAHQQPSLTAKKLRRLEITAGAKKYTKAAVGIWSVNEQLREAERELALQAEASYVRTVRDWQASAPKTAQPKKWARA